MQRFHLKRYQIRKLLKSEETGVVQVQPDKRQKFKKLDQESRQLIKDLLKKDKPVHSSKVIQDVLLQEKEL